jgi:uncharacterized protein (DUF488 family)
LKEDPLYSIGHGTRKIEDFIFLLHKYQIQYLADVRSIPYSRFNPQYRQHTFKKHLEDAGITYRFMGDELGGRPKDESCYDADGKVNYEKIKTKDFFKNGIEKLTQVHEKKIPMAMMCSESKPEECHRSKLITPELIIRCIPVLHIDEKGELRDQQEVIARLAKKKGSPGLFPD